MNSALEFLSFPPPIVKHISAPVGPTNNMYRTKRLSFNDEITGIEIFPITIPIKMEVCLFLRPQERSYGQLYIAEWTFIFYSFLYVNYHFPF